MLKMPLCGVPHLRNFSKHREQYMTDITPMALTVANAAKAIGISRTKFYSEVKAGNIRAYKSGWNTLIKVADLNAYLDGLPEAKSTGSPIKRAS